MPPLIMVCKSFNPNSRIIQLVHIWCSCLTQNTKDYVCREIRSEFLRYGCRESGSEEIINWVNRCHPEAYPYVTGVIGFATPWITTIAEARKLILERPYQYQGRRQFLDELAELDKNKAHLKPDFDSIPF